MGLYDRHYYRDEPQRRWGGGALGGGGIGGLSAWSVNTWIIVLCVAVFVIDGMLPVQLVQTDTLVPAQLHAVDSSQLVFGDQPVRQPPGTAQVPSVSGWWVPVQLRTTGEFAGWAEVIPMRFLASYLHFSTELGFLKIQYWRFIGFQFLHGNLTHLLFNMLALFFFGPMVEQYLGSKRYLAFYLLCGICGALMYLLLNLSGYIITIMAQQPVAIPGLLFNDTWTPLVGASAGIFGVLMAGAFLAPRAQVLLFFIIPMQLRTLAYVFVGLAFYSVITGGNNAGGEAGHLGGAIAGFYFIRRPHHLHGFFDLLGRADPTSHHYRNRKSGKRAAAGRPIRTDEVDRILDKINREGVHGLSDEEKRILREASRRE